MALPDGLYDLLLTEGLARSLAAIDPTRTVVEKHWSERAGRRKSCQGHQSFDELIH